MCLCVCLCVSGAIVAQFFWRCQVGRVGPKRGVPRNLVRVMARMSRLARTSRPRCGLCTKRCWLEKILKRRKRWELRSMKTLVRERIGVIESGSW